MGSFRHGDLVRVTGKPGPAHSMGQAVVISSYLDQFGCGPAEEYKLHFQREGQSAWYGAACMELVEHGRSDLLARWEREEAEERVEKGDLAWIFANGGEVLLRPHGASLSALGKTLGIENLWPSGEGIEYYENARRILCLARPFLEKADRAGWEEFTGK